MATFLLNEAGHMSLAHVLRRQLGGESEVDSVYILAHFIRAIANAQPLRDGLAVDWPSSRALPRRYTRPLNEPG